MEPIVYSKTEHTIQNKFIDPDALWVIGRLQQEDFSAYLVGGGVRDLLAGVQPKDFDISTSAEPEEIKKIFGRQCILIGRRFRLAHIRFGKKVLEVSTFRAGDSQEAELIVRDNEWGTEEQDVLRRDFTCNGLFYNPTKNEIIDYVGGVTDIEKKQLCCIGDPVARFHQDPVRMLRALKFQARLGFSIEPKSKVAIQSCRQEIEKSSPARLLEEIFKMLESGASEPFFHLMAEYGFIKIFFPKLHNTLTGGIASDLYSHLEGSDLLQKQLPYALNRGVLLASLLYPIVDEEIEEHYLQRGHRPSTGEVMLVVSSVIKEYILESFSHFPKRISSIASYVLNMQYRLTPVSTKRHFRPRMMQQKDFPHALELLKIRSLIDDTLEEEYQSWKSRYQKSRHEGEKRPHPPPKKRRALRYRRRG